MQQVSDAYKAELARPIAGAVQARVRFCMTDVTAAPDAALTAENEAAWSNCAAARAEDAVPARAYATLEPGRFLADGSGAVLPEDAAAYRSEGFVSAQLSGADGVFAQPPVVRVDFSAPHTVSALTFVFDAAEGEWPRTLGLRVWHGETLLAEESLAPDAAEWCTQTPLESFTALELIFYASRRPRRRARLQQILFGTAHTFTGTQLAQVTQTAETDPLCRRLPTADMTFRVVNVNTLTGSIACRYDPDNPAGVWRYVERKNPVVLTWGQQLAQGGTEWLAGGRYYLTAQPGVEGLYATFKAQALLSTLTDTCTCGVYAPQGRTLMALALDVLREAALPQVFADGDPWLLWEGLEQITTTAPLPEKKHRECLQLIAHAARCVLYTDRTGRIRIEPMGAAACERHVGLSAMQAYPACTKTAALAAVECKAYTYTPANSTTTLHSGTYAVQGETVLRVTYSQAAELAVTVQGDGVTLAQADCRAQTARITLTGSGTAIVTVTGKALRRSSVTIAAAAGEGETAGDGETETVDNPLITDAATALAVAQWTRDWLLRRTTYTCETRGMPELEPLDSVTMDSRFDSDFAARVLKTKTVYDGALSGALTLKRTVEE